MPRNKKNTESRIVVAMIKLAQMRTPVRIDQHVLEVTRQRFGFRSIAQVLAIVDRHAATSRLRAAAT